MLGISSQCEALKYNAQPWGERKAYKTTRLRAAEIPFQGVNLQMPQKSPMILAKGP